MIAAAGDKCYASGDAHSADAAFVRKLQPDPQRFRRTERDAAFHRLLGYPALPGQDGAVCHKGSQISAFQLLADKCLVFCKPDDLLYGLCRKIFTAQCPRHTLRKKVKENLLQLRSIDGAPVGREPYRKAHDDIPVCDLAGCALQNLLSAASDGNESAFSGAFGAEAVLLDLFLKISGEIILQGNAGAGRSETESRETCGFSRELYADIGGRSEGVALYVVNTQKVRSEIIGAFQPFVCGITFSVNGREHLF